MSETSYVAGAYAVGALCILIMFSLFGCTDQTGARKVLVKQGYSAVKADGYDWLGCGSGDWYHTKFEAVAPNGEPVTGVVCKGLVGKGSTVRIHE